MAESWLPVEPAGVETPLNPLDPASTLVPPPPDAQLEDAHPPQPPLPEDSAVTRAEKFERNGLIEHSSCTDDLEAPSAKRVKLAEDSRGAQLSTVNGSARVKGVVPIKAEFLVDHKERKLTNPDDDAAEASRHTDDRNGGGPKRQPKGQNTGRSFGSSRDRLQLCASRNTFPEFSPKECKFGDSCRFEHDLRKYLTEGKRGDLDTLGGRCPVWAVKGFCGAGWKCRFVSSHMEEKERENGPKELLLTTDENRYSDITEDQSNQGETEGSNVVNIVSIEAKTSLTKRRIPMNKAEKYAEWLELNSREMEKQFHNRSRAMMAEDEEAENNVVNGGDAEAREELEQNRAQYTEPPFLPSEKRRVYFGPDTPILAPLTTQGNLPFRRMCVDLGAQVTYSEMAMSLPLITGAKSEWALLKAHQSEASPPSFPRGPPVVEGYDVAKDLRFGAQIAGNKPAQVLKATEILTKLCPHLRVIDLNCGCPIDLVFRAGAGSALLDCQSKLEKMLRGMNAVSGEIPITVKIRMGTKDAKPMAQKLIERLTVGGHEAYETGSGPCGVAAITLHGRSRQQRYTRSADWGYISECAALIERLNKERGQLVDTVREPDARSMAATPDQKVYFIGNGDCYSHVDYLTQLEEAKVDAVMIARGALIKPWIFEEIEKQQYLDKSATERLAYVEKFARYGMEVWGSDEVGLGTTRRFLLEWLSFAHRYVPVGIMEHLPPNLQDRPPAWRGRNDLETLLGSDNHKDWIKISEMFLGPAHENFKFMPKHKSNSYEIQAEG